MVCFLLFILLLSGVLPADAGVYSDSLQQNATGWSEGQRLKALLGIPYDEWVADLDRGLTLADSALGLSKKLRNRQGQADVYEKRSLIYYYQGEYEAAVRDHLRAIHLYQELGDSSGLGHAYLQLGYQGKKRDLKGSIQQMETGVAILEAIGDEAKLTGGYDNLGVLYEMQGDYSKAGFLYEKVYQMKLKRNDSIGLPYSLDHLGGLAVLMGQYTKAEKLMETSFQIRKLRNDLNGMAESRLYQAELYRAWQKPKQVIALMEEAIPLGRQIGYSQMVLKAHRYLAEAYAETGVYAAAYQHQKAFSLLNDSLFTIAGNHKILQLEKKFEMREKEQENRRLVQEKEIQGLELSQQKAANARLFWTAVSALLSLLLLFSYVYARLQARQRAEKAQLQRQNFKAVLAAEEKERSRIARELHDSVGQLLAAAKLHWSIFELQVHDMLKGKVQEQIRLLDEAVQEVRAISHNLMPVALTSKGLFSAIRGTVERINVAGGMQIELYMEVEGDRFEPDFELSVYRMVQEVLSNMLKHAYASRIVLDIQLDEKELLISMRDNGIGFQTDRISRSSGIGWGNLRARTDLLGGRMEVISQPGEGTSVLFELPVRASRQVAA